jgi:hypothetical protein
LRFGLVDFDHAAVELGLVHVVDGFEGILGEGEFDVAEASMRVLGGFPVRVDLSLFVVFSGPVFLLVCFRDHLQFGFGQCDICDFAERDECIV